MLVGAAVAHDVGVGSGVLVAGQVAQAEQVLRVLLQEVHPAGNGSERYEIRSDQIAE